MNSWIAGNTTAVVKFDIPHAWYPSCSKLVLITFQWSYRCFQEMWSPLQHKNSVYPVMLEEVFFLNLCTKREPISFQNYLEKQKQNLKQHWVNSALTKILVSVNSGVWTPSIYNEKLYFFLQLFNWINKRIRVEVDNITVSWDKQTYL